MAAKKNPPNANTSTGLAAGSTAAQDSTTSTTDQGVQGSDALQGAQDSQAQGNAGADATTGNDTQDGAGQEAAAGGTDAAALSTDGTAAADPDAKREYVVGTVPLRHNARLYGIGHSVELTDAEADRLGGLVTLIPY